MKDRIDDHPLDPADYSSLRLWVIDMLGVREPLERCVQWLDDQLRRAPWLYDRLSR